MGEATAWKKKSGQPRGHSVEAREKSDLSTAASSEERGALVPDVVLRVTVGGDGAALGSASRRLLAALELVCNLLVAVDRKVVLIFFTNVVLK